MKRLLNYTRKNTTDRTDKDRQEQTTGQNIANQHRNIINEITSYIIYT